MILANDAAGPADTFVTTALREADDAGGVTIVVCSSCRRDTDSDAVPRPGMILAQSTVEAAEASDVRVRHVACLGNCKRGLSAAILRDGAWSYVFGGLDEASAPDLIAGAELFAASSDGFMPFRARPESLKRGLVARIPTFDSLKEII
jgi:predicted metal-binding protein